MPAIPPTVRADVIRALYDQADEVDWDLMSLREKTAQYAKWMGAPTIGGVLTRYLPEGEARVWLKDGPMKEYGRAREGIGPNALYATRRYAGPDDLTRRALGPDWRLVDGSLGEKPAHCYAANGTSSRFVCWGRPGTFRDLIWAAVNKAVNENEKPLVIVTLREGEGMPARDRRYQERIADHCRLDLTYLTRSLIRRT